MARKVQKTGNDVGVVKTLHGSVHKYKCRVQRQLKQRVYEKMCTSDDQSEGRKSKSGLKLKRTEASTGTTFSGFPFGRGRFCQLYIRTHTHMGITFLYY